MSLLALVLVALSLLLLGYVFYGSRVQKYLDIRDDRVTPAVALRDNVDFVPAGRFYLLGQHLSAIAAAGPIVGPILAGLWFGWVPALAWIIIGAVFIGGVHDITALIASVRHKGRSIAEVIRENMSQRSFVLFLAFLWLSLVYIITAFTDITASTFVDPQHGSAVASSSMMYLVLAIVMGIILRVFKMPLALCTALFLPLVVVCIYLGRFLPLTCGSLFGLDARTSWNVLLLLYCFIAAVIPVWLLLQPRGYLGGFFLLASAGLSFIGIIIGGLTGRFEISYPGFIGWFNTQHLPLFPILFTTVACGACSGFHALVASGTTSKQLSCERDARQVGYGGMILEAVVAIIALSTLMIVGFPKANELKDPSLIYANGIAVFLSTFGIDRNFALNFALLAFATFVYDTLDVATRLGRYIFEEFTGWRGKLSPFIASFMTLALPFFFVTRKMVDCQGNAISTWKVFWTVFGSSNQLLAGFVLFFAAIWLLKNRRQFLFTLIPSLFMITVAMVSLCYIIRPYIGIGRCWISLHPIAITASVLMMLGVLLFLEGIRVILKIRKDNRVHLPGA